MELENHNTIFLKGSETYKIKVEPEHPGGI